MMPSNLIRITFEFPGQTWITEYGERMVKGLTEEEEIEKQELNEELMGYHDFSSANEMLGKDRKALMTKKERYEELVRMEGEETIVWRIVDPTLIWTTLIILKPEHVNTYVENLPVDLMNKLFSPMLTIESANINLGVAPQQASPQPSHVPPSQETSEPLVKDASYAKVTSVLAQAVPDWANQVDVYISNSNIWVKPKRYLGDGWKPINIALKTAFGDCWKSKGAKDKDAHWEVPL